MTERAADNLRRFIARNLDQLLYAQQPTGCCPYFPVRIYLEPTNACNLRCVHCHHNDRKPGVFTRPLGRMDLALFRKVIDEIAEQQCEISLNAQGEPLLHREIVAMVEYSRRRGVFTSLLTNATMLTGPVARALVAAGLNRMVLSFDSVVPEEYESIRVGAKFAPTLRNILEFLQANEDAGHPTFVCCSMIPQSGNAGSLRQYDEYFAALPVDAIFHSALLNLSGASGIAEEVVVPPASAAAPAPICRVPWEMMTVNWDGEVTACGLDFNVAYSLGSVRELTLRELWNSERMQAFRQMHLDADFAATGARGRLCGACNCRHDQEYNFRNYRAFLERDLVRKARQYARTIAPGSYRPDPKKTGTLLAELDKWQAVCRP